MPAEQLSGTIVVIIIAVGVQACIMIVVFAKRQLVRFALKNRRGPHTGVGQGGPKALRREADRLLEYVPQIRHEPRVDVAEVGHDGRHREHLYRSLALEKFTSLERSISECYSLNYTRAPGSNVRSFLLKCTNGPLLGVESTQLHVLCDEYEHARHHFAPFGPAQLDAFSARIDALMDRLRANRALKPHPSPMPLRSSGLAGSPSFDRGAGGGAHVRNRREQQQQQLSVSFGGRGVSRTHLLPQSNVSSAANSASSGNAASSDGGGNVDSFVSLTNAGGGGGGGDHSSRQSAAV